jgi:beta-glucosidase-like glycosyl hydrolase
MTMDNRKKIAQLIIARLDGKDIDKKFKYYQKLVEKGIGGFILFGGSVQEVARGIKKLQNSAEIPLFIASDLEQGLGQQIEGGTLFPPAMALAEAVTTINKNDVNLLRKSILIIAREAQALGINIIFSPVLDVNTNPQNPIICTRAFSDNPKTVAWFGNEFIRGFQKQGLIACVKHFPGHGDTAKDSHLELPTIHADEKRLHRIELYPFKQAIKAGAQMVMAGHLKVPVLDSKCTASLSQKIITGLLKEQMKFNGLIITDAMNMHSVSRGSEKTEAKACLAALKAGETLLLHPSSPEKIIHYLSIKMNAIMPAVEQAYTEVIKAKKRLHKVQQTPLNIRRIGSGSHLQTAREITRKSIRTRPSSKKSWDRIKKTILEYRDRAVVLIADDDNCGSGDVFADVMKACYPQLNIIHIDNTSRENTQKLLERISHKLLIVAVFSKVSAWKGRLALSRKLQAIIDQSIHVSRFSLVAGFCCPSILTNIKGKVFIDAYCGSTPAQKAVAKILCDLQ